MTSKYQSSVLKKSKQTAKFEENKSGFLDSGFVILHSEFPQKMSTTIMYPFLKAKKSTLKVLDKLTCLRKNYWKKLKSVQCP